MARSYRDMNNWKVKDAVSAGRWGHLTWEEMVRCTGTLTHNWKQHLKRERRNALRAESRREIREQFGEMFA